MERMGNSSMAIRGIHMHPFAPPITRLVVSALVAALGFVVAGVAAAPPVAEKGGEIGEVAERVAVVVRGDEGERALEGTVVVEATDGAMLLELDDQRLELVSGEAIRSRRTISPPAAAVTPREEGKRILAELPEGFDLLVTRHYVICFDTSRAYAQWCGALFEKLHEAFINYWRKAGVEVEATRRPLVVVIFSDRQRYEAHAARDLGAAADRVVGYYNLLTNRITTFDLTGSDQLARRPASSAGRAGVEIRGARLDARARSEPPDGVQLPDAPPARSGAGVAQRGGGHVLRDARSGGARLEADRRSEPPSPRDVPRQLPPRRAR
jgi:hypothetical protein